MKELQPPGAGLPVFENNLLNLALKSLSLVCSDKFALQMFQRETDELVRIFEEDESYDVFQRLLIPRVIGIEDSSRNWSIAMVLEHLCLTNAEMNIAVESLSQGIVPRGEVEIALYKPDPEIGVNVLDRFREVNQRYVQSVEKLLGAKGRLPNHPMFRHPWFGLLGAHQWHMLASLHQRVHRRQAQKIVAMLGVT